MVYIGLAQIGLLIQQNIRINLAQIPFGVDDASYFELFLSHVEKLRELYENIE